MGCGDGNEGWGGERGGDGVGGRGHFGWKMWGIENVCVIAGSCVMWWCSEDLLDEWGEEYLDGWIWSIVD